MFHLRVINDTITFQQILQFCIAFLIFLKQPLRLTNIFKIGENPAQNIFFNVHVYKIKSSNLSESFGFPLTLIDGCDYESRPHLIDV